MPTPAWMRHIERSLKANSTSILSGVAVAGVITTAVLASRAALKVKERQEDHVLMKWTPKAYVQEFWKEYIPAVASGAGTIACIVYSNQIGLRRNAALIGAYTIAETAFQNYKDQVVAELGEIKERGIRDKVAIKEMEENPPKDTQVIITGGDDQLCYDTFTGRYFRCDIETIRRAVNETNQDVLLNMHSPHNDFYGRIGLAPTTVGDELGWTIDNFIELVFTAHLDPNGIPCLALGYTRLPRPDYYKIA